MGSDDYQNIVKNLLFQSTIHTIYIISEQDEINEKGGIDFFVVGDRIKKSLRNGYVQKENRRSELVVFLAVFQARRIGTVGICPHSLLPEFFVNL